MTVDFEKKAKDFFKKNENRILPMAKISSLHDVAKTDKEREIIVVYELNIQKHLSLMEEQYIKNEKYKEKLKEFNTNIF